MAPIRYIEGKGDKTGLAPGNNLAAHGQEIAAPGMDPRCDTLIVAPVQPTNMSYAIGGAAGYCEKLLTDLAEVNPANDPQLKSAGVGAVQALLDAENRQGTSITQVDQGNGHIRELRIKWLQRGSTADVVTGDAACSQANAKPYFEDEFFPTQRRTISIGLDLDNVRRFCDAESRRVNVGPVSVVQNHLTRVLTQLHPLRVAMNNVVISQIATYFGGVSASSSVTTVSGAIALDLFLNNNERKAISSGYLTMLGVFQDAELMGTPITFGGGLWRDYNNYMEFGCCNDGGFDFGQMSGNPGYKFYFDKYVGTASGIGTNEFVAFAPGTLQLGMYNENRGSFQGTIDNVTYFLLPDPVIPGLVYDARLIEDGCNKQLTLQVSTPYFDVWGQPTAAYAGTDNLAGTTGVFNMLARTVAP